MDQRVEWLDIASGILIIVMLAGHFGFAIGEHSIVHLFSFYMAWFFFKSGMFHRSNKIFTFEELKKLACRFLIPIGVFISFSFLLDLRSVSLSSLGVDIMSHIYSYIAQFLTQGFVWGNAPLWFLFALFFVRFFSYFYSEKYFVLCLAVCITIGAITNQLFYEKFQYLSYVPLGFAFYILGSKLKDAHTNKIIALLCFMVYMGIYLIYPLSFDFRSNTCSSFYLLGIAVLIIGIIGFNWCLCACLNLLGGGYYCALSARIA